MTSLAEIPAVPEAHLELAVTGAAFHLLDRVRSLHSGTPIADGPLGVLAAYERIAAQWDVHSATAWEQSLRRWEVAGAATLPLMRLCDAAGWSLMERRLLVTCLLVDEDDRFAAVFEAIQGPGLILPTVGLITGWWVPATDRATARRALRRLVAAGAVDIRPDGSAAHDGPHSGIRVDETLVDVVRSGRIDDAAIAHRVDVTPAPNGGNHPAACHLTGGDAGGSAERDQPVVTIGDACFDAEYWANALSTLADAAVADASEVWLVGAGRADRRSLAGAIAANRGRGLLDLGSTRLASDAACAAALGCDLYLEDSEQPERPPVNARTYRLPDAGAWSQAGGPLRFRGAATSPTDHAEQRVPPIRIEPPTATVRTRLWHRVAPELSQEACDELAHRWRWSASLIERVGRTRDWSGVATDSAEYGATHAALATAELSEIGEIHSPRRGWEALAVAPAVMGELHMLERRCRVRSSMAAHLGVAFELDGLEGVRALFAGGSGTGKSLAARCLAGALGRVAVVVDLSRVVSKYIGETEKNLERVFAVAERHDVVLILDEGDALLTRRTDVGNAHDRYANFETNYLLQRLERYRSIVIVTTNAAERIDPAFARRFDARVDFEPPRTATRAALLALHLPADHRIDGRLLDEVAARCELNGGEIRSLALRAALMAANTGELGDAELRAAVHWYYTRRGAACPVTIGMTPEHVPSAR